MHEGKHQTLGDMAMPSKSASIYKELYRRHLQKKTMNVELVIENARKKFFDIEGAKNQERLTKTWQKYAPIFTDYLNGTATKIIARKYNMERTAIYDLLHQYGIPVIGTETAHELRKLQRQLAHAQKRKDQLVDLKACGCMPCQRLYKYVLAIEKGYSTV